MKHILLVEDDYVVGELVKECLTNTGYIVHYAMSIQTAKDMCKSQTMDLKIIDLVLPDGEGFDLAIELQKEIGCTPIVFMTSKTDIEDVRKGFELGCCDYIKKPFNIEELLLRIKRILCDYETNEGQFRQIGQYRYNPTNQTLKYKNECIILGRLQSAVLSELSEKIGVVVQKVDLLDKYWEGANYFTSRNLDSVVVKLRERFKNDMTIHILALKKEGYRLVVFK